MHPVECQRTDRNSSARCKRSCHSEPRRRRGIPLRQAAASAIGTGFLALCGARNDTRRRREQAFILVAAITDFFDGYFARRYNQITRLGALLDPIADKLLMSSAFISLVEMDPKHVPAWMVVIIIGREFAVSGLRSIAAQQGVTIAASPLGKTKTVAQVFAIALMIVGYQLGEFRFIGERALWVVMLFALVSGVQYFSRF